ncbi:MAG: hypothetical protein R2752_10570 [Vicinamibacterales bacterium]
MFRIRACRGSAGSLLACLVAATPAAAQISPDETGWQIEAHIGGVTTGVPDSGKIDLPGPGRSYFIGAPFFRTTRIVPSWFFGDGALLFRQSNAEHAIGPTDIVPLDDLLTGPAAERGGGLVFGVRARRHVAGRFGVEFGLDVAHSGPDWAGASRDAIEASRASFVAAWSPLFVGSGSFTGADVSAVASVDDGSAREVFATAAVDVRLWSRGGDEIVAVAGGGVVFQTGDPPSATLTGHYQGTFDGRIPYDETDRVSIRIETGDAAFVSLFGAGWRHRLTARLSVTGDVRVLLHRSASRVVVSADPSLVLTSDRSRQLGLFFGPEPVLLLYNGAGSLVTSSLSPPAVHDFVTFESTGWERHVHASVGLAVRF